MASRYFKIRLFCFIWVLIFSYSSNAQNTKSDKHIEVSLRMFGHQVLLSTGNNDSPVSPIIKENGSYKIQFETEFEFIPEKLVTTIDSIVKQTNIAKNYILEVEKCETKSVVYSFEMNDLEKSDIVPCKSRVQPKSCYNLIITILDTTNTDSAINNTQKLDIERNLLYFLITIIVFLILGILFFLWKKNKKSRKDPNLIPIGAYFFDKRNSELIIEHQKIELTSKEADLLLLLHNDANITVKRDVILNMVWGDEGDYVGRTLDVFISKLRKKLEFDSKVKIVNVRGIGYKLVMDV